MDCVSGRKVVYWGRYHVHANTLSMMGCSRAKEMYWLLGRVQIRVVIEVGSSRIFFRSRCGRKRWADAHGESVSVGRIRLSEG